MNCPSRTDDTLEHPGWNQNPSSLNADLTTRNDFNGIANSKVHRQHATGVEAAAGDGTLAIEPHHQEHERPVDEKKDAGEVASVSSGYDPQRGSGPPRRPLQDAITASSRYVYRTIVKFSRFIGPGFLIAVAYIDPGNYATDVAAGASFQYALLFVVLLANLFAIFLQSLCIKLGTVTGLNLAENCREHLPRWIVYILYFFSEAAIVATDIAEVSFHLFFIPRFVLNVTGRGISNRAQFAAAYPTRCRSCHNRRRCHLFAHFLPPEWVHVGSAVV